MTRIVCIKHPKYEGKNPPELSCKACCGLYIDEIKRLQSLIKTQKLDLSFRQAEVSSERSRIQTK